MKTQIKANFDQNTEQIIVNAKFIEEKKIVHEITHGFEAGTSKEKIEKEIEKARTLFVKERKQIRLQKEVDKKFDNANKVVKHFNK